MRDNCLRFREELQKYVDGDDVRGALCFAMGSMEFVAFESDKSDDVVLSNLKCRLEIVKDVIFDRE